MVIALLIFGRHRVPEIDMVKAHKGIGFGTLADNFTGCPYKVFHRRYAAGGGKTGGKGLQKIHPLGFRITILKRRRRRGQSGLNKRFGKYRRNDPPGR
jgi:hypothetical protein